jgi:hypothetical protein
MASCIFLITSHLFMRSEDVRGYQGEESMAQVQVTVDEFIIDGDRVTHKPTEAWWSAYRDQTSPSIMCRGSLGHRLANGDERNEFAVWDLALRILRERPDIQ